MEHLIGRRIKEIALAFGYTSFTKFAKDINIPQSTLNLQISGGREANLATCFMICKTFPQIDLNWLILGKGSMNIQDNATTNVVDGEKEVLRQQVEILKKNNEQLTKTNDALLAMLAKLDIGK